MSRVTDLISQVKVRDAELGRELEREFKTLSARLPFGLNFERHSPETAKSIYEGSVAQEYVTKK